MTNKTIASLIVALLVGLGVGYLIHGNGATVTVNSPSAGALSPGGQTQIIPQNFVNGASFGSAGQSYFDNSGNAYLSSAGTMALSGAITSSGGITMTGSNAVTLMTRTGLARATTTVNSAETLVANDLISYNHISYTPNLSAVTLTLPASSTLSAMIPNTGDMLSKTISNATSTTGITVALVAGAGEFIATSSTANLTIAPQRGAILTFLRKANSDIQIFLQNGY